MIRISRGWSIAAIHVKYAPQLRSHVDLLTLNVHETLYCLDEDADPQRQKKDSIEKSAEQFGPLPAKGVPLRGGFGPFRNLEEYEYRGERVE